MKPVPLGSLLLKATLAYSSWKSWRNWLNSEYVIKSCFAEFRVIPKIEEVIGLLSGAQLLGFQPFLTPLSVNIIEETRSNPLSDICERTLGVKSSSSMKLVCRFWIINLGV